MNDNDRPSYRPSRLVLSYNIQGIPDWIRTIARLLGRQREICVLGLPLTDRLGAVIQYLLDSKADIICLQECFGKKLQRHLACALHTNRYNCVFSNSHAGASASSSSNSGANSPFQQYMTPGLGVAYRTDRYRLVSECFVSCRCSTDKSLKTDGLQIVVLQPTGAGGVVNTTGRCAAGVTILNVHAPIFKNFTDIDTRMNQAYIDFVNNIIQFYVTTSNLVGGEIVVAGDFNNSDSSASNGSSASDNKTRGGNYSHASWDPQHNLAGTDRYCHSYFNRGMSLDRILVNRPILSYNTQRPTFKMNQFARQRWLRNCRCNNSGSSDSDKNSLSIDCSDHFPILTTYQI